SAHNGLDAARALLLEAKLDCHDVPVNRLLAHCLNLQRLAFVDEKIDLLEPISVVIEHLLRCPICAPKIYRQIIFKLMDTQMEMKLSIFPEKVLTKTPLVNKPEIVIYEMHQLLV